MGREYELTPIPWDGLPPALNEGKIDVIINSMGITDERKKVIDFSDKYYDTTCPLRPQGRAVRTVRGGSEG